MNDNLLQYEEREWVEQVIQLLRDIARAGLSDLPKLPENISIRAIPLAKKAKSIQEEGNGQSGADACQSPEMEWVEQVISLLSELSRISLSDRPKLPDAISHKALELAKQGQKIKEASLGPKEETVYQPIEERTQRTDPSQSEALGKQDEEKPIEDIPADITANPSQAPGQLLDLLASSLKIEWANSKHPDAPEWQQLINLLDIAKGLYQRTK
ncbi:MAG: inorganic pyrophosphatase [Hormoscilla sp.]